MKALFARKTARARRAGGWTGAAARRVRDWLDRYLEAKESTVRESAPREDAGSLDEAAVSQETRPWPLGGGPPAHWLERVKAGAPQLLVRPEEGGTPWVAVGQSPMDSAGIDPGITARVESARTSASEGTQKVMSRRAAQREAPERSHEARGTANAPLAPTERLQGGENSSIAPGRTAGRATGGELNSRFSPEMAARESEATGSELDSRFPAGMTDRKARASANAKAAGKELNSRFPAGMTERKANASANAKASAKETSEELNSRFPAGMTERKANASASAKASAKETSEELNSRFPAGMTERKANASANAKASAKETSEELNSRFPAGMTERKAKASADAKASAKEISEELNSRFPAGMTERKANAKAKASAKANANANSNAGERGNNAGFVGRTAAELWPEVFGRGVESAEHSRLAERVSGNAAAMRFPDIRPGETVKVSDAGAAWTRAAMRVARRDVADERRPEEMRDLWPELPEAADDTAFEMARAMRQWERAMRVDREQRGEF